MQLHLDKNQKSTLFEQAREQLLTALHTGKVRPGDRLPSIRQVALRNRINTKTAFSIYQRLREEGYVELRTGSGAYASDRDGVDLDQLELGETYLKLSGKEAAMNEYRVLRGIKPFMAEQLFERIKKDK